MNKKRLGVALGITAILGIGVLSQSNLNFAMLSEKSTKVFQNKLNTFSNNSKFQDFVKDYDDYKEENTTNAEQSYLAYKDDTLHMEKLLSDKAIANRVEEEIQDNSDNEIEIEESEKIELKNIGEIPGPRNDETEEKSGGIDEDTTKDSLYLAENEENTNLSSVNESIINVDVVQEKDSSTSKKKEEIKEEKDSTLEKGYKDSAKDKKVPPKNLSSKENFGNLSSFMVDKDVYVRQGKNTQSKIIGTAKKGEIIQGKDDSYWVETTFNNEKAYVSRSFLSLLDQDTEGNNKLDETNNDKEVTGSKIDEKNFQTLKEVTEEANSLLKKPYVHGKNSPNEGFDSSGLVFYLYERHANITLNRTCEEMLKNGYSVMDEEYQKGDLFFFKTLKDERNFVGIYIEEDKIIYSSLNENEVIKVNLDDLLKENKLVDVRRVIGES